jgi:hypothetical protein
MLPARLPLTARLEYAYAARAADLPRATRTLPVVAAADGSGSLAEVMNATGRVFSARPRRSATSTPPSRHA